MMAARDAGVPDLPAWILSRVLVLPIAEQIDVMAQTVAAWVYARDHAHIPAPEGSPS